LQNYCDCSTGIPCGSSSKGPLARWSQSESMLPAHCHPICCGMDEQQKILLSSPAASRSSDTLLQKVLKGELCVTEALKTAKGWECTGENLPEAHWSKEREPKPLSEHQKQWREYLLSTDEYLFGERDADLEKYFNDLMDESE